MESTDINVPRDLIKLLSLENEKDVEKRSRLLLAAKLYTDRMVTLKKATELAGTPHDEFAASSKKEDTGSTSAPRPQKKLKKNIEIID